MGPFRTGWARAGVLWTCVLLVVALVLAAVAMAGLLDGEQACFIGYPSVPCPDGQDWRVALLTVALVGIPLVWLVGLVAAVAGRAVVKRRERHMP